MKNRPLGKQLKILWLSTFIDKFDLSIDNYRQISSTIDLSTTFSMIDFDRHVTSCVYPKTLANPKLTRATSVWSYASIVRS